MQEPEFPSSLLPWKDAILAHLHKPMTWFVPLNQKASTWWQSKIGGFPYLPKGSSNLLMDEDEHRYNLLIQINFEEIPPTENFPARGILQIFSKDIDYVMDDNIDYFRFRYYPSVEVSEQKLITDFEGITLEDLDGFKKVPGEGVAISFQTNTRNGIETGEDCGGLLYLLDGIEDEDERTALYETLNDYIDAHHETIEENEIIWKDLVEGQYAKNANGLPVFNSPREFHVFCIPDHQIGGMVSQFWQGDPRNRWEDDETKLYHSTLLLSYDARGNCTELGVPYQGFDAKLLFFINPKDLQRLDFSEVLYHFMS